MLRPFPLRVHVVIILSAILAGGWAYHLAWAETLEQQLEWHLPAYLGMALAYALGCAFYMDALRNQLETRFELYMRSFVGVISGTLVGWVGGGTLQLLVPYSFFRALLAAAICTGSYMLLRTAAHVWPRSTSAYRRRLR